MNLFLVIPLLFITITSLSQQYIDVGKPITAQDLNGRADLKGSSFGGVGYFAVNTFLNVYDDSKRAKQAKESAIGKTEILKSNYEAYDSFPLSIVDGWHEAVATDHHNFCENVQVLVSNNKVIEFVIDGCIRIACSSPNQIKKGKGIVTLNNFNSDKLELVNIYFMYDMEEPHLILEPMQAGYVCIWSNRNVFTKGQIVMNRVKYGSITKTFDSQPKMFEDGTFNMVLKPGTYTILVQKAGNDKEHKFEIKSGKCLMYKLK